MLVGTNFRIAPPSGWHTAQFVAQSVGGVLGLTSNASQSSWLCAGLQHYIIKRISRACEKETGSAVSRDLPVELGGTVTVLGGLLVCSAGSKAPPSQLARFAAVKLQLQRRGPGAAPGDIMLQGLLLQRTTSC